MQEAAEEERPPPWRRMADFLRRLVIAYNRDEVPLLSAAIAFYALLSVAPILVVALALAETIAAGEEVRANIVAWASRHVSEDSARLVDEWASQYHTTEGSGFAIAVSAVVLVVSATRLFSHVSTALDRIWHMEAAPPQSFWNAVITRLLGLAIVGLVGLLLLVAIGVKVGLRAAERWLGFDTLPFFWNLIDWGIYFALVGGAVYVTYRRLPRALVKRRHALIGACTTAALLIVGGEIIAFYVSRANVASSYGAAGSTMALVIWVYYASQVFLIGALVTWLFAGDTAKVRKRRLRRRKKADRKEAARKRTEQEAASAAEDDEGTETPAPLGDEPKAEHIEDAPL
ncbi:MAG: YihY/virulence factor BrkB family protein [Myxococcota bacterium]